MFTWFATTLRQYPEIAIFLVLALGYYFGKFTFRGIGLGSVTATLLAGVLVGQLGITIGTPLKATVFLMFLFAVGYGVGRRWGGRRNYRVRRFSRAGPPRGQRRRHARVSRRGSPTMRTWPGWRSRAAMERPGEEESRDGE